MNGYLGMIIVGTALFGGLFIFFARLLREDLIALKKEGVLMYSVTMSRYRKTMVQCFFIAIVLAFFSGVYVAKLIS
jgi:hypothetical protein